MLTAMWAALALLNAGATHREWTRSDFVSRLRQIQEGDSESKVLAVLGQPDDIWQSSEFPEAKHADDWKSWSYGSHGHLSFPIFGRIEFVDGRVDEKEGDVYAHVGYGDPPVVPADTADPALDRFLIELTRPIAGNPSYQPYGLAAQPNDPLLVIRWSNQLRQLDKEHAVAILCCLGLLSRRSRLDEETYWTCQALFDSPEKKGLFGWDVTGQFPWPSDLELWPKFPVLFMHHVPFILPAEFIVTCTNPLAMPWQIRRASPGWQIQKQALVPMDDPFLAMGEVRKTGEWKSLENSDRMPGEGSSALEYSVMFETILLVRTVCQPEHPIHPTPFGLYTDSIIATEIKTFDWCHKEFLRLGGHWDKKLQMYVRRDGSHL